MIDNTDIRSLDHLVVSVLDAEQAGANYEKLGFHVLPLMRHIEIGSCNRVIQFKSNYLELIGDLDKAVAVHGDRMLKRFDVGEGLSIVSLTATDLEKDRQMLQRDGLTPDPVISARRKIGMPDGSTNETNSSCFYIWRDNKEYLSLFYSAHYKPETIFVPGYYNHHPNGAKSVTGITYISQNPAGDVDYFKTMFRADPESVAVDSVKFVTPRGETFDIVSQDILETIHPNIDWSESSRLAGFPTSLDVGVGSLAACERVLTGNGIDFEREDRAVTVDPAYCNGVLFRFHE